MQTNPAIALSQTALMAELEAYAPEKDKPRIAKVRYTHDAMIDCIIAEPDVSQNRLAEIFGFTPGWVSIVINSDAFKARLASRKADLVDANIIATVRERFEAIVSRSTDVLLEKLAKPTDQIADSTVLKAMEIGAKALGVGGNAPPTAPPGDHLSALANRLLALQRGSREVIEDVQFTITEDRPRVREEGGQPSAEAPDAGLCGQAGQAVRDGAQASANPHSGGLG